MFGMLIGQLKRIANCLFDKVKAISGKLLLTGSYCIVHQLEPSGNNIQTATRECRSFFFLPILEFQGDDK